MQHYYDISYEYISNKTGNVVSRGQVRVAATDLEEAKAKALTDLQRNPRVQGTEGFSIKIKN